jgi:hypothetical protein
MVERSIRGNGRIAVRKEYIFVLNEFEKRIAGELIQKFSSGDISPKGRNNEELAIQQISYEYYSGKEEKIVRGIMLGCPYKLRYRDRERIFFSAWDCMDVCSIFYDVVGVIHAMTKQDMNTVELYRPFEVDLHTETYIFLTGDTAGEFVLAADHLSEAPHKITYSSQYIFSVFDESDKCGYDALIQRLKTEGYSKIQILQVWIRGEILYYAIADGIVMRSSRQRILNAKEAEDISRKIYKAVNDRFRPVDL